MFGGASMGRTSATPIRPEVILEPNESPAHFQSDCAPRPVGDRGGIPDRAGPPRTRRADLLPSSLAGIGVKQGVHFCTSGKIVPDLLNIERHWRT
jgi:hypothetical protein